MKRFYLLLMLCSAISLCASAQIGYQVSLLNNATGEPRANEQVAVTVKITDSEGKTVCEEKKNETSNDFGVLSMTVGDSETFENADWSKLPFFIEATIDGRLIGKSQLLSVPVAEYAKRTGSLTKEVLMSQTWDDGEGGNCSLTFQPNTVYQYYYDGDLRVKFNKYKIDGNFVILYDGFYSDGVRTTNTGCYYYDGQQLIPVRIP